METFKEITGLRNIYFIGDNGTIKNLKGKIIKTQINRRGYLNAVFFNSKIYFPKSINITVHQLVARHFVDNPENKKTVNHIDGNKLNNSVSNLEWCTQMENIQHANETGLSNIKGEKNNFSKLTETSVLKIRELGKYSTYKQIAADNNMSINAIYEILLRKTWKHI